MNRGNGSKFTASPVSLISNIADFGNDITTLAELQAKLGVHDAKECVAKATIPVAILVMGASMALACLPVILLALADLLTTATAGKLSPGVSKLIVAALTLVVVGLASFLAYRGLTSSLGSFRRSREELVRNLSWIRTVLVYSGRGVSRPQR